MKKIIVLFGLLFQPAAWAHHTRDHMMLSQDAEQVIAATRAGTNGDLLWLLWVGVLLLLFLGVVRWWRERSK